jgi:uncharacterized protein YqgV (UPF0045/DUF77 family)
MNIQAEINFYPLAQQDIGSSVDTFCREMINQGLHIDTHTMSSVVSGDTITVMHSLAEALNTLNEETKFVLVCKISNACPTGRTTGTGGYL